MKGRTWPAVRRRLRTLARDRTAASALEFAIVAPVLVLMTFGLIDVGQLVYGRAVLDGAVEAAARDASLETGNTSTIDADVLKAVSPALPGVTISSARANYYDFSDIARAERWNDANKDGTCSAGESYVDENRNNRWDSDIGQPGNGGAYDVVVYTVTATFRPVVQLPMLPMFNRDMTMVSRSVRKNQPFASQARYGSASGTCA